MDHRLMVPRMLSKTGFRRSAFTHYAYLLFQHLLLLLLQTTTIPHYCRVPANLSTAQKTISREKLSKTLFARVSGDPFQLLYEPSSCSDDVKE